MIRPIYRDYLPSFIKSRLVENGVRAKWVKDAFISKTFPNHFTIVTGLYEESHGIVSNRFDNWDQVRIGSLLGAEGVGNRG